MPFLILREKNKVKLAIMLHFCFSVGVRLVGVHVCVNICPVYTNEYQYQWRRIVSALISTIFTISLIYTISSDWE